jgi:predicted secreted acid phosphatase
VSLLSRVRRPDRRTLLLVVPAVVVGLAGGGAAVAATAQPAIVTTTPVVDSQVPNIDVVRQQIKNYYGDPLGSGQIAPDSNYAKQVAQIAGTAEGFLTAQTHKADQGKKAILLDVDDTSLTTYNYEIAANFAYTPAANGAFVTGQQFPAVPGMPELTQQAAAEGYAVFYLTGRGAAQEAATLGNLTVDGIGVDAGFAAPTPVTPTVDGLFTKPALADYPDYLKAACGAAACSTVQYKSATRAYIESQGYDIIANFGDQQSDLTGGSADRTIKLPNPMYFIP